MTDSLSSSAPNPFVRYFMVMGRPRTWSTVAWLLLGLPLGIAAFTYVVTMTALGLGLAITLIGIPLLVAFLFSVRALAALEGRLANVMLGAEIAPVSFASDAAAPGLFARVGALLRDGLTWRGLLYLALRLPIGIVTFTLAVTLLALAAGLIITPLTMDGAHVQLFSVRADTPAAAAACVLTGVLLLPAVLHLLNGAGWVCAQIARALLRSRADVAA